MSSLGVALAFIFVYTIPKTKASHLFANLAAILETPGFSDGVLVVAASSPAYMVTKSSPKGCP
jgi:hypothetical protein